MSHADLGQSDPMHIPAIWRNFLFAVAIGKAAIGGAGLALALLGALDIAAALTAQEWLREIRPVYLDYATAGGGFVGAVVGWLLNR